MSRPQAQTAHKLILSLSLVISSGALGLWQNVIGVRKTIEAAPLNDFSIPTIKTGVTLGEYMDGSYIGEPFTHIYGTVQVEAIVRNGMIVDVKFLKYPNERDNSIRVNTRAMPLLTQEAISVQSERVDGVSGATQTTNAFRKSLASALVLAKK